MKATRKITAAALACILTASISTVPVSAIYHDVDAEGGPGKSFYEGEDGIVQLPTPPSAPKYLINPYKMDIIGDSIEKNTQSDRESVHVEISIEAKSRLESILRAQAYCLPDNSHNQFIGSRDERLAPFGVHRGDEISITDLPNNIPQSIHWFEG